MIGCSSFYLQSLYSDLQGSHATGKEKGGWGCGSVASTKEDQLADGFCKGWRGNEVLRLGVVVYTELGAMQFDIAEQVSASLTACIYP
jgi:hypothetical protein